MKYLVKGFVPRKSALSTKPYNRLRLQKPDGTRWDSQLSCVARTSIVFNGVRLRLIDGWQIVKSNDGWPPKTMNFDKSDAKERIVR